MPKKIVAWITDHDFGRFLTPVAMKRVNSIEEFEAELESDCIPIISSDYTSHDSAATQTVIKIINAHKTIIFYFMWNADPNHMVNENDADICVLSNVRMDQELPEF